MPQVIQPTLPILEPFSIPDLAWHLTDYRQMGTGEQLQCTTHWEDASRAFIESDGMRADHMICRWSFAGEQLRADEAFETAFKTTPGLDYWDFLATPEAPRPLRFSSSVSLPRIMLGIMAGRKWIGALYISNVEIEVQDDRRIEATALMWIGTTKQPAAQVSQWLWCMRHMLNTELRLVDRRALNFMGCNFTSDDSIKQGATSRSKLSNFMALMAEEFDGEATPDPTTGDIRFRRRPRREL